VIEGFFKFCRFSLFTYYNETDLHYYVKTPVAQVVYY